MSKVKLTLVLLFLLVGFSKAQINLRHVVAYADSTMQYGVTHPMIPGGVLSLVTPDSVLLLKGYGFSNYEEKLAVDPQKTLFQLGSIGKVFTAIAVLQQVEEQQLSLKEDVNKYLEGWQIENPFDQAVTLSHLLTHSAGFDDRFIGYLAKNNDSIQPLGQHLKAFMPKLFQKPGKSINYSNYSYALAGHLVEIASENNFQDYIKSNILTPTRMNNSSFYLPDNYKQINEYARGYRLRETFEEVTAYPRHATPAGSIIATAADLSYFMQALLNNDSSLLSPLGYDLLLNQQFSNHPLLTGYTFGLEVQDFNGMKAVGKGGNVPGFISLFLIFPELNIGMFLSVNTQTDNFFELFMEGFANRFFPDKNQGSTKIEVNNKEFAGIYRNQRTSHRTIEEMFSLFDGQFSLRALENGNLGTFHNGQKQEYAAIDHDVFQNINLPNQHLIFERDTAGKVKELYRNVVIGGFQVPASYQKMSWFERPRFINDEYPFALIIIVIYLLLPAGWFLIFLVRKRNPYFLVKTRIPSYYHAAALLFLLLFFWNILGFFVPLLRNRTELLFGFPEALASMQYFNYAMAVVVVGLLVLTFILWLKRHGNLLIRMYYLLFTLTALSYILMLHRWHFISITH